MHSKDFIVQMHNNKKDFHAMIMKLDFVVLHVMESEVNGLIGNLKILLGLFK